MKKAFLGIDTSNYTTSASIICGDEFVFKKIPLSVRHGEKGVRQSEAVFQHVKNIPALLEKVFLISREKFGDDIKLTAVGVSDKPRTQEGSYMPCFLSGVAAASSVASSQALPLYTFSHQEGHIRAAVFGSGADSGLSHFYSFHLSGGTCELLKVRKEEERYHAEIIADSADITLGQLIDRAGVLLGLQFPCGPALERLAEKAESIPTVKIKSGKHINLSGFENKVIQMQKEEESNEDIAAYVFGVAIGAVKALLSAREDLTLPVVFSGGVCSSHIISSKVAPLCQAYFAPPVFSADNAIGIAALSQDLFLKR